MSRETAFEGYKKLVDVTSDELLGIMEVSLLQRAKDAVKKMLGRSVRTKDPMFWPAGMLMLGLVTAAEQAEKNSEIREEALLAISSHVDMWLHDYKGKIDFVDDALAGYCFIKAYKLTGEEKYKIAAEKIAQFILTAPRDSQGTIIYNPGRNSANIFADGIGQVAMFMAKYTAAFSDSDIVSSTDFRLDASKQLKNFFEMGVDKNSGLNYHGYSVSDNQRKGLLGWGRAFGWLFMGTAEATCAAIENKCDMNSGFNVTALYRQMCETALKYQRQDGGWSWQMQAVDGHIDMSATGMISYSIARGYKDGLLDEEMITALKKAGENMEYHIRNGQVMEALSSCDDFGVHYQTYGHYPWGQGAVLSALALINEID